MVFDSDERDLKEGGGSVPTSSEVEERLEERKDKLEERKERSEGGGKSGEDGRADPPDTGGGRRKKRDEKKRGKKRGVLWKIFVIGLLLITISSLSYLGYMFYEVRDIRRPDVPSDELSYRYPGEEFHIGGIEYKRYPPRDVVFRREEAYEESLTDYLYKIIPLKQVEMTYINGIDPLAKEPPFFGQFHIGSVKTVNEMSMTEITSKAHERMEEVLHYRYIETGKLVEEKPYEYKIDGEEANYYEYEGVLPRGSDEPDYVKQRTVKIVLVVWSSEIDRSGKYFIGLSVVKILNKDAVGIARVIEDETTWDKILSLIPRISIKN